MKKTLFLIFSGAIVIFSVICICSAPIVNQIYIQSVFDPSNWGYSNCKMLSDGYKIFKDTITLSGDAKKKALKQAKRPLNLCNGEKAMYGLEHASFIIDIILACLCLILALFHYFDVGKPFEKVTGIIGLATGVIQFVLTLVYVCYSGYIFTSFGPENSDFLKADKNGIYAKWIDSESKYKCEYYDKDDENALYAKYNNLGKKIYNYDKDTSLDQSISSDCRTSQPFFVSRCNSGEGYYSNPGGGKVGGSCDSLYVPLSSDVKSKYLYDRWITTIIFACFIIVCDIGLAIFGFLLFKSDGSGI